MNNTKDAAEGSAAPSGSRSVLSPVMRLDRAAFDDYFGGFHAAEVVTNETPGMGDFWRAADDALLAGKSIRWVMIIED